MSKLKLEAGKFYRTRSRGKVKLLEQMGNKWFGAFYEDAGWRGYEWDLFGQYYAPAGQCGMDLISEWNDDDDWEDADPSKITFSMLPLEARFRNESDWSWCYSKLYGYWPNANRYQNAATDWWEFCQVKKGVQK